MSCCPPGSFGSLEDDYTPVGVKSMAEGTEFYGVGSPSTGGRAVVIIPDIWGWDSGRIRRFADMLSSSLGCFVVVPKLLVPCFEGGTDGDALPPDLNLSERGQECWPWLAQFNHVTVKPKTDSLFAHLKEQGIVTIGVVGICWGGWLQAHLAAEQDIACMVTAHPSLHNIAGLVGDDMMDLAANVKVPWLMMPCGNDPATYLPGGEVFEVLSKNNEASKAVHFPEVNHGFFNRGDVTDVVIKREVLRCYAEMEAYLMEHMQ